MFLNAKAFNQNISGWHVGKVTNMTYMFHNATSFNQNIGSWDVGKVTDMSYMFSSPAAVSSFAQPRKVLSILFKVIEVLLNISVAFAR
jgi:surface protein